MKFEEIYYDFKSPGAFGGIRKLQRATGESYNKVKDWLQTQRPYTLHHPVIRKFQRNKTIARDIDEIWQADLVDMQKYATYNGNHTFILTVIDTFSKFAFAVPLKNKRPDSVIEAFSTIFKDRKPRFIHTDKGMEFLAHRVQSFFKNEGIHHYSTENETIKASVSERWNQTLKRLMFRVFTYRGNYRYMDILQDLVQNYNNTFHRSIQRPPGSVKTGKDSKKVFKLLYPKLKKKRPKFKIGNTVRISMSRNVFARGFKEGNWSEEIFTIHSIVTKYTVPVYRLKDFNGEILKGAFYEKEIQKVGNPASFAIDRIIKRRKIKGKQSQVLVTWRGYPESHQTWINENDIGSI